MNTNKDITYHCDYCDYVSNNKSECEHHEHAKHNHLHGRKRVQLIEACMECTMKPNYNINVQSHVCRHKGKYVSNDDGVVGWDSHTCWHPIYGDGKECYRKKFNEEYCDYDVCYECPCDELGWCEYAKSKSISIEICGK